MEFEYKLINAKLQALHEEQISRQVALSANNTNMRAQLSIQNAY